MTELRFSGRLAVGVTCNIPQVVLGGILWKEQTMHN